MVSSFLAVNTLCCRDPQPQLSNLAADAGGLTKRERDRSGVADASYLSSGKECEQVAAGSQGSLRSEVCGG